MNFSSVNFLFLFLPVLLGVLFLGKLIFKALNILSKDNRGGALKCGALRFSNIVLILFSFLFYFAGEKEFTFLLLFSAIFNFLIAKYIEKTGNKNVLWFGIAVNLGILGVFKYLNFFIYEINLFLSGPLGCFNLPKIPSSSLHLPVGISFFTFQAVSYIIDVYRKEIKAARFLDFTLYLSLFPQLVAGPIVRYREIKEEISKRTISLEGFSLGLKRFISGLAKKVIIADTLSYTVDKIFSLPPSELSAPVAVLGAFCYTFQIFFDFSGYSDMAIGLGKMFGFKFPENFNYPYISGSIKEFWRRWHMTLSGWFRDYLYFPLGGSRKGEARTYFNILTVFLLTGLWHGAGLNFVVWGLYNGILIVIERAGLLKGLSRVPKAFSHIYFGAAVLIGWVIFRSESLGYAASYIKAMFFNWNVSQAFGGAEEYLGRELVFTLFAALLLSFPVFEKISKKIPAWVKAGFYIMLLVVLGGYISANTYKPFIYFRF